MPTNTVRFQRIGIECESIETSESWGVGRFLYKLLEQLSRRPELARTHRFHLYFKKRIPDYPFLRNPAFVCTVTTPHWMPVSFNLHYHVWMIARAYRDRIQTLFLPAYMLPMLWFKKSVVMLTEDVWHEIHDAQLPFRYRLAYGIFANWAARYATRIMAISESSKKELVRLLRVHPERIFVNHLAAEHPKQFRNSEFGIRNYILYVAQAFPRRHLRETIQAFETLASEYPALRLIAVGPDKYRPPLTIHNERIIRKERVSDEELAQLYAGATVLVYVSDREAFGLPPLEALTYGTPAILADKPVHRELFGDQAFYVTAPTTSAIASALRDALTDTARRERIRQNAPAILARFSWRAHTDRWLDMITAL